MLNYVKNKQTIIEDKDLLTFHFFQLLPFDQHDECTSQWMEASSC